MFDIYISHMEIYTHKCRYRARDEAAPIFTSGFR